MKDKRKARRKRRDDDAITSDMLVEIMEESIRIFWRLVRADKDSNIVIQKTKKGTQVEPLEPDVLELLAEVQTNLQKVSFQQLLTKQMKMVLLFVFHMFSIGIAEE